MAIWNQASNIETRETIWVSRNIVKGRAQLNSHRDDDFGRCYQRDGIDGFPAAELAGLHSPYAGNDWQSKYMEFIAKWSEVEEV
jgi:hypothetical protein